MTDSDPDSHIIQDDPPASMTFTRDTIDQELERHLLHGLACEWEAALWVLEPVQRQLMQLPLFRLQKMKSMLGYWSGKRREICINRDFAYHGLWADIREVLLHEMAHQFAEGLLPPADEPPHGQTFQRACRLLRADPAASASSRKLSERLAGGIADGRDRMMVKIRKLMALADSHNRHEAQAAMRKAHELMRRHNIRSLETEQHRDFVSTFLGTPSLRHTRDKYHLADLITTFYFVRGIWISAYVLGRGKMGRVLEISGTPTNVRIAAYVHEVVVNHIDACWYRYNRSGRHSHHRKTDFAIGIIEGLRSNIDRPRPSDNGHGNRSVVPVKDHQLSAYVRHRYPHTTSVSQTALRMNESVYNDGRQAGKRLVIAKGITRSDGYKGRLIARGKI